MLTADLVRVRRRGLELRLVPLSDEERAQAVRLAEALLDVTRHAVGGARAEVEEAWEAAGSEGLDTRVVAGLRKLVEDRCAFAEADAESAEGLRREVFLTAAAARRAAGFDRAAVLAQVGASRGIDVAAVDAGLFADLRDAHALLEAPVIRAEALVAAYEDALAQAVLLRAVRVRAEVRCRDAAAYRALFRRLKFHRLLYTIAPDAKRGYRIEVDGPFSLFEQVTAYGLKLALLVPALAACESWSLEAEVRWGKRREALTFKAAGGGGDEAAPAALPDDVTALAEALRALRSPWEVQEDAAILPLPGVGLCVPDLQLVHRKTGEVVFVELLGYWSRDAVWRRVELVEQGLSDRIVFCVSDKLRVSEDALGDERPAALYVFKRAPSAKALLERVEALAARGAKPKPARKRRKGAGPGAGAGPGPG